MGFGSWLRGLVQNRSAYDSGDFGRRNQGWSPIDGTGETVNQLSRDVIRNRARDLERNSDNVAAVIDAFERNIVGTGIRLQAKALKDDGTDDEELNKRILELWEEWCKFENCEITGQFSFAEVQKLSVRRRLVDGGLLIVICMEHGAKFPFKVQLKEVDELDVTVTSNGNNKVVGGIELNEFGRAVAYHFKIHDVYGWTGRSVRVDAKFVIYLSMKTRPSEIREISPLAKILTRLRDLNQYVEAVSVKERVLACLSVFIKKINPKGAVAYGNPKAGGVTRDKGTGHPQRKLAPGTIETLDAGDEIQVVNPSGQASNAREFVTMLMRSIGAALGLSYETTSRDMSQVNYSSARQGMIDDFKTYKIWQAYLIDHLCKPIYVQFLSYCVLSGLLDIPDFFINQNNYTKCSFIPNGMSWIDPLKEVRANQYALDTCQITLEEICSSRGQDYREVIRQRAFEEDLKKQYGLGGDEKREQTKKDAGSGEGAREGDAAGAA